MGGYTHACQALLFQDVDLVNQCSHLRSLEQSRLFTPGSLELGELSYKGGEAGFVGLAVEPCFVPSPEGIFQWKIKKTTTRASLKANTAYDFPVCDTQLVFQKEIVFEQGKIWRNLLALIKCRFHVPTCRVNI
jgi:hypothetical protein